MIDLDDLTAVKEVDSDGFLSHLETLPEQLASGRNAGREATRLPEAGNIKGIAILGMGGSGISGDVVQATLESQVPVFVGTVKGYDLPAWVGPDTLVFAVSYSGTTEETLHAFLEAQQRGAPAVLVGSGGLLERAASRETAVVKVPHGLPPRAALGHLAMPMLVICERLGLCSIDAAISETIGLLRQRLQEYKKETPASLNPAKQLARELAGTVPIVYGSEGIGKTAAYRWKCQFNECSKVLSFSNAFPELDHNELEGWAHGPSNVALPMTLIALRHEGDNGRKGVRIDLTLSMIEPHVQAVRQVVAQGESAVSRLFDLIYLGDFTAAYLGLIQGKDPGSIQFINRLKAQMNEQR